MSSHHTNRQLPFDVLGLVFSHYAEEENIQHPLETLLLVCRSWTDAALGHRSIWSSLKILIKHEPSTSIWRARLPLRLARCGPNVPLDIVLCNLLDSPRDSEIFLGSFTDAIPTKDGGFHSCGVGCYRPSFDPCPCYATARAFIDSSLELLAGDRGELCRRWSSFKLITAESPRGMQGLGRMDEALRYPTPILTKVVLKGLSSFSFSPAFQLFPDAPVLEKVTIIDCDIRSAPNFGNAADVEIGIIERGERIMNTLTFDLGTSMQRLSLWLTRPTFIQFPPQLPTLRVLELVINLQRLPRGMFTCKMPQLTSLSLDISDFSQLYDLSNCGGINLSRLKELTLNLKRIGLARIMNNFLPSSSGSVVELLERARSLEYLYANEHTLTPILYMLRNAQSTQASDLLRGVCVVNLDTNDTIIIKG